MNTIATTMPATPVPGMSMWNMHTATVPVVYKDKGIEMNTTENAVEVTTETNAIEPVAAPVNVSTAANEAEVVVTQDTDMGRKQRVKKLDPKKITAKFGLQVAAAAPSTEKKRVLKFSIPSQVDADAANDANVQEVLSFVNEVSTKAKVTGVGVVSGWGIEGNTWSINLTLNPQDNESEEALLSRASSDLNGVITTQPLLQNAVFAGKKVGYQYCIDEFVAAKGLFA